MVDRSVVLSVSDVSVSVRDARILEEVSFDCLAGEWTVIHGPSGSGKSTLLRAINGLCTPTRGYIRVLDTRIPGRSRREARTVWRRTGTILQEVALFETKTALENVVLALRTIGLDRRAAREEASEWLERLNLGDKLPEYPSRLSGGQRQRVALARAFAVRPRLLVLDEPTSALDRATAQIVLAAVKELVEEGTTVVMSSHRMDEVTEMCDQRIGLHDGRLSAIESPAGTRERVVQGADAQPDTHASTQAIVRPGRQSGEGLIRKVGDRDGDGTDPHENGLVNHSRGHRKPDGSRSGKVS
jgi:ABC-type multidrug transport system ATPase subunit